MTSYARVGSVSSGTMRPEDLIPAFLDALDDIRERLAEPGPTTRPADVTAGRVRLVGQLDEFLGAIEGRTEAEGYYESEEANWDLEALFDRLGGFAPPYCHFGAHEGDGADYGFWPDLRQLEEDASDAPTRDQCTVYRVDAGEPWPVGDIPQDYVMEVNDHGNVTLYTRDGEEVWSVV